MSARRFRWRVWVAAALFTFALTFAAAELTLRALGVSYPVFWTVDPHLGLVLRPDTAGWFRDEGGAYVTINAHGMRDRPRETAKAPGVYRIAVLGDSFIEALQVPLEKTFCAQLEARLSRPGHPVEVLNFGCSGYGTAQELLTLRHRVRAFAPDLVLLALLTGNDLADNERSFDPILRRPYFVWQGEELVLDESFRDAAYYRSRKQPVLDFLASWCRVFQLANALRRHGTAAFAAADGRPPPATTVPKRAAPSAPVAQTQPGLDDWIYLAPTDELWKRIWRTLERLLLMTRDEAAAQHARFGVVIVSNGIDVHPDGNLRDTYARSLGAKDLAYPSKRVEAFLAANGVPCLSLVEPLRAYAEATGQYLHGFAQRGIPGAGHWNEIGHAQAAQATAPWVVRQFAP